MALNRFGSERIDQADQLALWTRLGDHRDRDRYDDVDNEGKDGGPEVLGHVAGILVDDVDPAAMDTGSVSERKRKAVMDESADGAGEQAQEGGVAGGPFPEHTQQ